VSFIFRDYLFAFEFLTFVLYVEPRPDGTSGDAVGERFDDRHLAPACSLETLLSRAAMRPMPATMAEIKVGRSTGVPLAHAEAAPATAVRMAAIPAMVVRYEVIMVPSYGDFGVYAVEVNGNAE
jgi:hypothetical protein